MAIKTNKRFNLFILSAMVFLFYFFGAGSLKAYATPIQYSGTSGTCSWEIDIDGVLRIYPTDRVAGMLDNFVPNSPYRPEWLLYSDMITAVIVEKGVATNEDSSYMFSNFTDCISMDLSGLDTSNSHGGWEGFVNCTKLIKLILPENFAFETIGDLSTDNWVKVKDLDGVNIEDNTRYTFAQMKEFNSTTTPSIGGTWCIVNDSNDNIAKPVSEDVNKQDEFIDNVEADNQLKIDVTEEDTVDSVNEQHSATKIVLIAVVSAALIVCICGYFVRKKKNLSNS